MATKKLTELTELTELTSLTDNDLVYAVDAEESTSKKLKFNTISDTIKQRTLDISRLDEATTLTNTDLFYVLGDGSKKVTFEKLKNEIGSGGSGAGLPYEVSSFTLYEVDDIVYMKVYQDNIRTEGFPPTIRKTEPGLYVIRYEQLTDDRDTTYLCPQKEISWNQNRGYIFVDTEKTVGEGILDIIIRVLDGEGNQIPLNEINFIEIRRYATPPEEIDSTGRGLIPQ